MLHWADFYNSVWLAFIQQEISHGFNQNCCRSPAEALCCLAVVVLGHLSEVCPGWPGWVPQRKCSPKLLTSLVVKFPQSARKNGDWVQVWRWNCRIQHSGEVWVTMSKAKPEKNIDSREHQLPFELGPRNKTWNPQWSQKLESTYQYLHQNTSSRSLADGFEKKLEAPWIQTGQGKWDRHRKPFAMLPRLGAPQKHKNRTAWK